MPRFKRDTQKVYSDMVDEMCRLDSGNDFLESCMRLDSEAIRRIPLRYRIIALAFTRHMNLDELNEKLASHGCPKLYARSFWEATLIYAFSHGYDYERWRELQSRCMEIYETRVDSSYFREKAIKYGELRRYVEENSDLSSTRLHTQQRTQSVQKALLNVSDDEALVQYLHANISAFSETREKTRYYFCKYLCQYIEERIERYLSACRNGRSTVDALAELACLQVVTKLKHNTTMPEEKKLALMMDSGISSGVIFGAFNYFYFGYVSSDWADVRLEFYDSPEEIPDDEARRIAAVYRKLNRAWKGLSDREVIRLHIEQEDAKDKEERGGELTLYKCIRGTLDIDRTSLICFLIFFCGEEKRMKIDRLNDILLNCGFAALDADNDVDWFAEGFLSSSDPLNFLTDVMIDYARNSENSFLYHVYGNAVNTEDELKEVMLAPDAKRKK